MDFSSVVSSPSSTGALSIPSRTCSATVRSGKILGVWKVRPSPLPLPAGWVTSLTHRCP